MTKAEKIWLFVGFLGLAALILLEVNRVHKSVMAAQGVYGSPQSTNPIPAGQQLGPNDGSDAIAAGVGPWYLYYNTPGTYRVLPPLVNTSFPPAQLSSAAQSSATGCENCS